MEQEKMNILVVEDNPADAQYLGEILRRHAEDRFSLVYTSGLQNALKRLSEERIHAVILYLFLPDSLGLESLEQIHAASSTTPIFVMTGLYDDKIGYLALQKGARCYLAKQPLNGARLVSALLECV